MARVVVVGSVARDQVVRVGEPLRVGAHLQGGQEVLRLGGGGANTAVALAHAGEAVSLVAAVGSDPLADELLAELATTGVDVGPVVRIAGSSTRSLVIVDPTGERTIVNLTRARESEPPQRLARLAADCVYVRSRVAGLAPLLVGHGLVVAHIPPIEDGLYPAQVLVCSASDLSAEVLADPLAAGRRVAGTALRWVVVTLGRDGVEAFGVDGERLRQPAPAVSCTDSTGAGDAFAAGLVYGLARGLSMARVLPVAVRWGAAKVGCDGSVLSREAVAALVRAPD
jgi:sugar/nucleoside kinase (ribokinase family)